MIISLNTVDTTVRTNWQLSRRTWRRRTRVAISTKSHAPQKHDGIRTNRLDPLGVKLVVFFGVRPVQTRIALFVHEEEWEIHFLELQLYWMYKELRNLHQREV